MFFENGDPFGFGGMGGDYRANPKHLQQLPQLLGGDLGGGRAGDHLGKGAPHLVIAPVGFGLPPPAHGRILLGDAQQLEPEPLHLKSSGHQVGARVGGGTLSAQCRLQLGLPLPNQTQQQSGEKLDDLVGVCGRAGGGRISRLGKTDGGEWIEQRVGHPTGSRSGDAAEEQPQVFHRSLPMATRVSCVALPDAAAAPRSPC